MDSLDARAALRAALDNDPELAARFAAANTESDFQAIVEEAGIDWAVLSSTDATEEAADVGGDLSDAELASMSGGFIPRTDWFTCEGVKPPWFQ